MKFWSRVTRILLATVVASQGAVFLPAMAASQSKRLAVKAIGIEELKSEYGAGGGTPPPPPPPPPGTCSAVAGRLTVQCAVVSTAMETNGPPVYLGSYVSSYGSFCVSQANPSYTTDLITGCSYTEKTGSAWEVSGGFTLNLNGKIFEVVGINGGVKINGKLSGNTETSVTRSGNAIIAPRTYQYLRPKYKYDKFITQYAVYKTYDSGVRSRVSSLASVYQLVYSTHFETTVCDYWGNNCTVS